MYAATTSDQRSEIYGDVVELLTPGFLTHPVDVGGHDFVLRSFFPTDLEQLHMRVGRKNNDRNYKNWVLAMSVCMVDGQIFLDQQTCILLLYRHFSKLPESMVDILFSLFKGLQNRVRESVRVVVAYSYEDYSRDTWLRVGENFSRVSGYEGIEKLGLNTVQMVWASQNKIEDMNVERKSHWEGVKLIAATQAPKEIQKMSERDEKAYRDIEVSKQEVMDLAYYEYHNFEISKREVEKRSEERGSRSIKTVETLEGEFENWVRGEKDFHDQVVQDHKNLIKRKMEESLRLDEERIKMLNPKDGFYIPKGANSGVVGYTSEQVQALIAQTSRGGVPGTKYLPENVAEQRLQVYRRHLLKKEVNHPIKIQWKPEDSLDQKVETRMKDTRN